ncbi:MAG: hypothetical protein AAF502_25275, partial [Bacteroidota bacterium]
MKTTVILFSLSFLFFSYSPIKLETSKSIKAISHEDDGGALVTAKYTATIGASIFGAFNQRRQSKDIKAIKGILEETIKHLKELQKSIEEVQKQNKMILAKLDRLPIEIRSIVKEEIALNELNL